jgi:hypothetical protein
MTITRVSTSNPGERPVGRVISADARMMGGVGPEHAAPSANEVKPVAPSLDITAGPSLELSDPRLGKPPELKPGLEELASPKPLSGTAAVSGKPSTGPVVRLVNKKRITLNYEVKDVGPSGVSGVELWYTRDAKEWRRHDSPPETKPPYLIEVQEEGLYGFTLLAKNGIGLGKEPPHRGDLPQVWVEVDLTRPAVTITDIKPGFREKEPVLSIHWKAGDKNLANQPINISSAEKPDGPWQPIASNLENSGQYLWPLRPGNPTKMYIRVEAKDLAGNVGVAQTSAPIQVDMARPTVQIVDVETTQR